MSQMRTLTHMLLLYPLRDPYTLTNWSLGNVIISKQYEFLFGGGGGGGGGATILKYIKM